MNDQKPNNLSHLHGRRFCWLFVAGTSEERTKMLWRCLCYCGHESLVTTSNLKSGNSVSCGGARGDPTNWVVVADLSIDRPDMIRDAMRQYHGIHNDGT